MKSLVASFQRSTTLMLSVSLLSLNLVSNSANAQLAAQAKEGDLQCRYIYQIQQGFLINHVRYNSLSPELEQRVVDQYIKRLDPTKLYFVKTDIDQIKTLMKDIFKKLQNRDCAALDEIQKIILKRAQDKAAFVKKTLGKGFKVDNSVEITLDPDKRQYAATQAESEEFLKKYLQFQVANYLATDSKIDEAKSNVTKNYERSVKRIQDRKADDIYSDYLDSFARALDPHSSFFSRDVLEDFEISMSLQLEGIGATLSSQDGFTVIEALVPGGAAARSNMLKPQDRIMAVGEGDKGKFENVMEQDLRDVVKKIRGKKGTKVRLQILRKDGEGKGHFEVTLVRDQIKLEDEAAQILYIDREINGQKKKFGLLKFPSFYADAKKNGRSSAADLKKLIAEANQNKVDGLVLDLSENGGGSLEDAVKVGGLFFATGNVVKQSAKGEAGALTLKDTDPTVDWPGPLVVLTSRISASASEIVSGTLHDYKRAVIVGGDHTFGKGTVQSVVPIPGNLGAIKVTVGMFFTAGGNSTQHIGVPADVVLPGPYSTDEIGEKSLDYSLPPKKLDAFLSPEAYVKEGTGAWKQVNDAWIKQLKEKSQARVDKNDDFKKIVDEMKKNAGKTKTMKVSEILKDKDEKKKEKAKKLAPKDEKDREYLKRADIQEAVNVLSDLYTLENSK